MIFTNWKQLCATKCFHIVKTGPAPVWLDSKNYSRTFHLATLSEEIIVSEKTMLKLTLKHLKRYKLNKKLWAILLEKRSIKDFKFRVKLHSFIPHFLFRILLWSQVNFQSSFRIFYNLHYKREYQKRWTEN